VKSTYLLTKCQKIVPQNVLFYLQCRWHMLINFQSQMSQRIFLQIQNGPNGILRCRGKLIHEKNLKLKVLYQTPFNPPGVCTSRWNMFTYLKKYVYFSSKSEMPLKNSKTLCDPYKQNLAKINWKLTLLKRKKLVLFAS
jgi:hypothetical protein